MSLMEKRLVRRRLIAGLVVIAPVTATVFVLWWIFQALDALLGQFIYPLLSRIFERNIVIPGLGLIALFLLLIAVGWAAERAIGSRVVSWWHNVLERIPVTRRIYGAANRIVRTLFGKEGRPFNQVVLVEYPGEGRWAIGFLAASAPDIVQEHVPDTVAVFVPSTPNPTTGWLAIVPRTSTFPLAMTIDEAFTYILSGGSVKPGADQPPVEVTQPAAPAGRIAPTAAGP
jgi:uncharacterized membrane protein